eukprot:4592797-Prymnesium_polylepis.2
MPSIEAIVGGGPRCSIAATALCTCRKATATAAFAASTSSAAALSASSAEVGMRCSGALRFGALRFAPAGFDPPVRKRRFSSSSSHGFESSRACAASKACSAAATFSACPFAFRTASFRVLSACLSAESARPA